MVHIPTESSNQSAENKIIVKNILKVREEHARQQKKDYSHVFRAKNRFDFFRLSCIVAGIEFAYAAETAFVTPILLKIGIQHEHMTLIWGLSPILGFFLTPLLGTISDRCRLSLGRRRPIIIALAIGIFIGLLLVPFGKDLGLLLGDTGLIHIATTSNNITNITQNGMDSFAIPEEPSNVIIDFKIAAILTIIGTVFLDLNVNANQGPSRAYLLDVCVPSDHAKALSTFTTVAGLGATFGYIIGAIDWEQTKISELLGGNIPTVFTLVTIIYVICVIVTLTSFREIPLPLIETDKLMRPLTAADIEKEIAKIASGNEPGVIINSKKNINDDDFNNASYINSSFMNDEMNTAPKISVISVESNDKESNEQPAGPSSDSNDDELEKVTFGKYLKSIVIMPKSMRILCLTNLFSWMSNLCYALYFTDFVGEAVFGGDPAASAGKEKNQIYEDGVRFGCWGLAIYALSCAIYSMSVGKLIKLLRLKWVYMGGLLMYSIATIFLAIWPSKVGVLVLSMVAGVLYATLFTIPYILIAQYHAKQCFKKKLGENIRMEQSRGLGTDISVISSMIFIGQIIVSMSIGTLIKWLNTTSAVIYASSVLSFFAAISSIFVLYLD